MRRTKTRAVGSLYRKGETSFSGKVVTLVDGRVVVFFVEQKGRFRPCREILEFERIEDYRLWLYRSPEGKEFYTKPSSIAGKG